MVIDMKFLHTLTKIMITIACACAIGIVWWITPTFCGFWTELALVLRNFIFTVVVAVIIQDVWKEM